MSFMERYPLKGRWDFGNYEERYSPTHQNNSLWQSITNPQMWKTQPTGSKSESQGESLLFFHEAQYQIKMKSR